ncbi:conserved hypothetical protein [Sporisorium reilianum SRZ2]|uniref:Something about silencing protein 4 domain-containing protein n=1 Tax=Sporisorium reilianum (strain SRZ2) TaxID=999809 RepID=E6ZVS6_SPORE|nr:conserved hypothetical protein [Sporisorium reilianum SRZ2]
MAAGLFASLFSTSSASASGAPPQTRAHAHSDTDDTMADAAPSKEAQDVADVDMQLSSPPSSPPASDPAKPAAAMERTPSASGRATVQRASRRRTMPARLSQVSALLAGSMLEEELLLLDAPASPAASAFAADGAAKAKHADAGAAPARLSASSIVVLTSDARVLQRAVFPHALATSTTHVKTENDDEHSAPATLKPASTPPASLVSTLAIKRQQLIETPDFTPRDDTLYMPKTRGLRSDAAEDTADAAYDRRHRRPEAAEKRQRKAEVDRLARDRLKLLARIDALRTVDARMLQPVVVARDQVRGDGEGDGGKTVGEKIEEVRRELLDDAHETLKRYDVLLSLGGEAKGSPGLVEDEVARSASPRLKIRIKGGRATWDAADSAGPTSSATKTPSVAAENGSRRVSARQPKQRVDSLPVPLTAAKVEAVEERRRRRRRSGSPHESNDDAPERRARRRSRELGGTYKGKSAPQHSPATTTPHAGRPQRAAAAAAAVAQKQQRQYAERSFSLSDSDDEQVDSALDTSVPRERRAPSAESTASCSSAASSLGYMYPTVVDTGSAKVSQSLAEIRASAPDESASKRIKLALSPPSDSDSDSDRPPHAAALTESEAESILAAFLGTTPLGKSARLASAATADAGQDAGMRKPEEKEAMKRRSTRREATQSFGEKLPDVLTRTVPFDFSVMGYLRSIDRPARREEGKRDGER